jgi:hypothetical protein
MRGPGKLARLRALGKSGVDAGGGDPRVLEEGGGEGDAGQQQAGDERHHKPRF